MAIFYTDNDLQNLVYQLDSEIGLESEVYEGLYIDIVKRFGVHSAFVLDDGVRLYLDDQYRINLGTIGYSLWRDILVASNEEEWKKIQLGM